MGRASGQGNRTSGTVTALAGRRRSDDPTRLDVQRDRVWLSHGRELTEAAALLSDLGNLRPGQQSRLCTTMQAVGQASGLRGPWRVVEHKGRPALGYCAWWDEQMPSAANESTWKLLDNEFDGGLIDDLPEPRYLGRMVGELADAMGDQPWQPARASEESRAHAVPAR